MPAALTTSSASSARRGRHSSLGRPELDEVEHRELVEVAPALAVATEARADLEDTERAAPDPAELAQEGVEVRGQHRPQAVAVLEPEDLLPQRVAVADAHLGERLAVDDERSDDLDEPRLDEGGAQDHLELAELRGAPGLAQLDELRPAGAHEVLLEPLEGGVARRRGGEVLVERQRVGAELAQALRLGQREPDRRGVFGAHGASCVVGARAASPPSPAASPALVLPSHRRAAPASRSRPCRRRSPGRRARRSRGASPAARRPGW